MTLHRNRGVLGLAALGFLCLCAVWVVPCGAAGDFSATPGWDPATAVIRPDQAPGVGSPEFPLSAYSAFGSSLAKSARFADLGWTEPQLGAFLEGIRGFLQGRGYPMDDASRGLAAELARRMGGGAPVQGSATDFPLSAYSAFGSSLAYSAHFAQLGWSEAELGAFLEGLRAAVLGTPYPMDDTARKLAAEMGRRIAEAAALAAQQASGPADPKARLARYFKGMRGRLGLQISDS